MGDYLYMGDYLGENISIIDEEGKVIDVVGVTEIKAENIESVFKEDVDEMLSHSVIYEGNKKSGTVTVDVTIPRLSRKRFKKLMMSRGFSRNTSERLHNVFMNMYKSRDYISFYCFVAYMEGMMSLGEEMVIL